MTEIDINLIWNQVLPLLEKSLNRPVYETLVSSTKPLSYGDGKFEVAVPAQVVKDWLSKFCVSLLEQELRAFVPEIKLVYFTVGPEELFSTPLFEAAAPQKPAHPQRINLSLNFRYTFDSFVVGHGNRFAHAAALAVAESPATAYNPFFLYGGVGLGKTHLMQAIGHRVSLKNPKAKILYTTSEMFPNEPINAIRDDKNVQFRNKYRNIDVLMVDDVQFIAGKERTQEEFFHTFNALYEAHKQIVLSSDRPPKEMLTLEERLRSRFEWGLVTDIQPPDLETRTAILRKKAEGHHTPVPDDVTAFIAERIHSNIRELEGALIRVVAYSSLVGQPISLALAHEVLKDMVLEEAKRVSLDVIQERVAEYFDIRLADMKAKRRTKQIAYPRQIAMYLARQLTDASLPAIGEGFGGRDHSTVLYACGKIEGMIKTQPEVRGVVERLTKTLRG